MSTTISKPEPVNPGSNDPGVAAQPGKLPFLERFADRMNPILVKEVRQAMKGRGFIITFMLVIGCCWAVSFFGALSAGTSLEYYSWANQFFASYFLPLAGAVGIVVPFLAYNSMLNERLDDTFEMLSITTLNARRIVNGKLTNAITLVLLCFSAITPFIAFTSLLQGFRMTPVIFVMTFSFFSSIGLCAVALLLSTLAQSRIIQGLLALALVALLITCASQAFWLFDPSFWMIPDDWQVFGFLGCFCLVVTGAVYLLREITVAQITFESDNRATGIRLVCSIIVVLTWIGVLLFIKFFVPRVPPAAVPQIISIFSIPTSFLVLIVSYFSCTEPPMMSQRVRKQVSRIPSWLRFFAQPWLPGCFRGYVFCLLHVVPIALINYIYWSNPTSARFSTNESAGIALTIGMYTIVYAGVATLLSRIFAARVPGSRTIHVRASLLVLVAAFAVTPHIIVLILEEWRFGRIGYSWMMASSPFATLFEAADGGGPAHELNTTFILLFFVGFVLFVVSLNGIVDSFFRGRHNPRSGPNPNSGSNDHQTIPATETGSSN